MALEDAFECPWTLERLRGKPLGGVLDGFCDWFMEQGYCRYTVRTHLSRISHLNSYLDRQGVAEPEDLSENHLCAFLEDYPSRSRHRGSKADHLHRMEFSVHRFTQYLHQSGLFKFVRQQQVYETLLDEYIEWMDDYQHAAAGTIDIRRHSLSQFLEWLGSKATPQGLAELTPETVERFFLSYAQKIGRSARHSMQAALRTFFRFCLHQGYIQRPLDCAVPTLRTYKLATVPRGLTDEQAQKVVQSINRSSHAGRRDYAICQMLYTYGVRGGQVRALRLEDVNWARNKILFKASKHGKDSLLPLTAQVGESLLDYLQNARPPCQDRHVFLTTRAPYYALAHSNSLSAIVDRCIRVAGIDVASKGAHTFRHCFATRMVQRGYPLKAVADVLGHRYLSTTFIYTKVDFNALSQVALEWPEEVRS